MKWKQPEPAVTDTGNIGGSRSVVRKKIIIAIIIILLLASVGVIGLNSLRSAQRASQQAATHPCKDTSESGILHEASKVLDPRKSAELKPLIARIQTIQDYDKQPDCMNIVTTYYINISDLTNAQANLAKLEAVYDPQEGFSKTLGPDAKSMEVLREDVAFLNRQLEFFMKNRKPGPKR